MKVPVEMRKSCFSVQRRDASNRLNDIRRSKNILTMVIISIRLKTKRFMIRQ